MGITSPSNKVLMSILLIAIACMLLITSSEFQLASAGYCIDSDNDGYYAQDCGKAIDCDDNNAEKYPGHGCIDHVLKAIDDVSDELKALVGSEGFDINSAQVQSLLTKLQQASAKVDSGNITSAIGKLNSFINQINAFYNSGLITYDHMDYLAGPVQGIIDTLQ